MTGLRDVYSQEDVDNGALEVETILSQAGGAVTGLSIDPNDANHVVVTVGGTAVPPAKCVNRSTRCQTT